MNTLRNTVSLIGRLGADPAITQLGDKNSLAGFSLATNEAYKVKKGEWVENATWHNVVAWVNTAELCKQCLTKGLEIALDAKLVNDSYETTEGEKRYKTEDTMREFMVLNRDKSTVKNK